VLAAERHQRIIDALAGGGIVGTHELATALEVSAETVRRDLVELEQAGLLERVRGGATIRKRLGGQEPPFSARSALAKEAKSAIARSAATLAEPGMTVMIDVGTTCVHVARALATSFQGLVVTCSLPAATALSGVPGIDVIVSGGRVRGGDLALSNHYAVGFFQDLQPDLAFLGSGGVDATIGLTDFHVDEVATRRVVLQRAAQSYVLADSTKFDTTAPHRVCNLGDFTGLITEQAPRGDLAKRLAEAGTEVLVTR
jgi:DeoR/GlpR family transcriptional regulator of sugar metabolism